MGLGDFLGGVFGAHTDEVKPVVQAQQIGPNGQLLSQQQSYADALQAQALGEGPSLATNLIKQQSDTNAANMQGMAAAQRGVNPGLAMKQALDAGAMGNQQAMQQASNARVHEQLGAQGMLGSQLNTMQGQSLSAQQANQGANMQANGINAGIATGNTATNNQVAGGVYNGVASGLGKMAGMAHGGVVPQRGLPQYLAGGGFSMMGTAPGMSNPYDFSPSSPGMGGKKSSPAPAASTPAAQGQLPTDQDWSSFASSQPGALPTADQTASMMGTGGDAAAEAPSFLSSLAMAFKSGGKVPGQAKVKGDSYSNDVVPTMLSPGELVIPRSVSTSKGFIEAIQKHIAKMPGQGPQGFAQVLAARRGGK